jgi:hypothetical protein
MPRKTCLGAGWTGAALVYETRGFFKTGEDSMTVHRTIGAFIAGITFVTMLGTAVPLTAQSGVSSADIQRLQDEVYQAGADLSRLRTSDALQAGRLQDELDGLREDVIYLKVKLRKENSVSRGEYTELRDQLQDLRARARGESRGSSPRATGSTSGASGSGSAPIYDDRPRGTTTRQGQSTIPAGHEIDVRIQSELTSDNAQVEDRFEATTVVDLYQGERVIVPAGSVMRGLVTSVNRASRTDRKGSLTVSFNQITVNGRNYPMRGTVTQALESSGIRGEAGRIGAGSAVGAIIGGIIGGVKGALLGVLIGGGGTMVATEGQDVTLPAGTILRVRMDTPPEIS